MNLQQLKRRLQNRRIYIWGARQLGLSTLNVLRREDLPAVAFIDSSADLQGQDVLGLKVLCPQDVFNLPAEEIYIIISSGFYAAEIGQECLNAGLKYLEHFIAAEELQKFDYQIDISGSCNLHCISCPRGNFHPQPKAGFMKPETFADVLEKILREDPMVGAVALYNWGEPLLNPHLPEIINICHDKGVHSAVSTNLSFTLDFTDVVKAGPTWFRISTSGFGKSYEVTHTGGKWDLFWRNIHLLKKLKDEHRPEMEVEVFYHIYKDRTADYLKMKELCGQLGFTLRVRHAALAPLDNISAIINGEPVSEAVKQTAALQALSVEEAMAAALEQKDLPCPYARCLWITWDLQISKCMEWFHPDLKLVETDFLSTPLKDIIGARENSQFCRDCKQRAIHRCFLIYGDENLIAKHGSLSC